METLDVTVIEPRLKHSSIFEKYDALESGQSFVIHNDHDPKPLYYQLIEERGRSFNWEYLKQGPEFWEVKITKLNEGARSMTIGELVAEDIKRAEVFRSFGLDFCCGGGKSVREACREKGINPGEVENALENIAKEPNLIKQNFNDWELDFLADYIVNIHHKYVSESLPMLHEISAKVAEVHRQDHPEVVDVASLFQAVAEELTMHMHKEENILFPYIKSLASVNRDKVRIAPPPFGSIANPIRMMEAEHESAGGNMDEIRQLSNSFNAPSDACATYRLLYMKLEEFEHDLHQHIHLENNILFPKAEQLERELLNA